MLSACDVYANVVVVDDAVMMAASVIKSAIVEMA